jgi:hypothetical protein
VHRTTSQQELSALVQYLRDADGDFLLIGDSTVLYGLTGKVSPVRALWLDPGHDVSCGRFAPIRGVRSRFDRAGPRFRRPSHRPRGFEDVDGVSLNDFPTLKQLAAVRACGEKTFGEVRVLEMCSDL